MINVQANYLNAVFLGIALSLPISAPALAIGPLDSGISRRQVENRTGLFE